MSEELFHVLNRGVDKRKIFINDGDRVRFVHGLFAFNDASAAYNTSRIQPDSIHDLRSRVLKRERNPLVSIHGWCLMGNHYHLLLQNRVDGGVTKFIRKLNIGHSKFFNEKYHRVGTLFQGRTKKIPIRRDAHFLHILHYIHLNPLDMFSGAKTWREKSIKNSKSALDYLGSYRWSSYKDYCGDTNFPSILDTSLFSSVFGNYKKEVSLYLKDIEIDSIKDLLLE